MAVLAGKLEARARGLRAGGEQVDAEPAGVVASGAGPLPRVSHEPAAGSEALFVDLFLEARARPPGGSSSTSTRPTTRCTAIEGRFFHGYYDGSATCRSTCSAGRHLLAAEARRWTHRRRGGRGDRARRRQVRARWPRTRILLRANSGFAREALMAWCEQNGVDFVFGLARNIPPEYHVEGLPGTTSAQNCFGSTTIHRQTVLIIYARAPP